MVRLCSAAARRGAGVTEDAEVAGVRLRAISGITGETDESGCVAVQEDATGFYGILLICNNCSCTEELWESINRELFPYYRFFPQPTF